jgi:hypothetical protein
MRAREAREATRDETAAGTRPRVMTSTSPGGNSGHASAGPRAPGIVRSRRNRTRSLTIWMMNVIIHHPIG